MGVFICEKCLCMENTAMSNYWNGGRECSLCDEKIGKWHDRFERVVPTKSMVKNNKECFVEVPDEIYKRLLDE